MHVMKCVTQTYRVIPTIGKFDCLNRSEISMVQTALPLFQK
jgi:septin family protein